ncbi:MAG: helix-turn-helix domain-containing protein [Actinoplanes sp.]
MAEGTGMGPVAAFCAELAELQRRSGRSHASLAHELNISRGHLYTILKGEVKRPPDWNRVVEPFVRACGADRDEVIQWRKRHDVLVQVVEELRRERRRGDPALDEAEPLADGDEPDERPPPARDYAPRGRRRLIVAGALVLILIAALAGAAVWYSGRDRKADAGPCFSDAPPAGSDLMDVPHYRPDGDPKYIQDWWSSDSRAALGASSVRSWEATVRGGSANKYDLIVLRSCLPLVGGRGYKLTMTVSADQEVAILVKVQEPMGVSTSANEDVRIGPQPRRLEFAVHGARTARDGEVTFHLGGTPKDFQIKVSDVSLVG